DARLRRAGLDYHEWARIALHDSLDDFTTAVRPDRLFAVSTRGLQRYDAVAFAPGDAFLFGPETRGLPDAVLDGVAPARRLRLPMLPGQRSLNLSNAVAVLVYEAWRQSGYAGAV
ncbi:MAG: tRNA (cytidine(34)-2'-O)-methyltransferase, partial [Gammaproteobacteria bacterium]|nr:tRNA (cytidine(34)-2'-O)-methyltransferase [Gammaproteobacteria bacterium]